MRRYMKKDTLLNSKKAFSFSHFNRKKIHYAGHCYITLYSCIPGRVCETTIPLPYPQYGVTPTFLPRFRIRCFSQGSASKMSKSGAFEMLHGLYYRLDYPDLLLLANTTWPSGYLKPLGEHTLSIYRSKMERLSVVSVCWTHSSQNWRLFWMNFSCRTVAYCRYFILAFSTSFLHKHGAVFVWTVLFSLRLENPRLNIHARGIITVHCYLTSDVTDVWAFQWRHCCIVLSLLKVKPITLNHIWVYNINYPRYSIKLSF